VGNLNALGLSADVLGPLPELSPQASLAALCWSWCEGWAPERWPLFDAFHAVPDWGALVELLQVIRDESRKQKPT
jgi:hypothetical protein